MPGPPPRYRPTFPDEFLSEALESVLAALPQKSPAVAEANKWKSAAQATEEKYRGELQRRSRQADEAQSEVDRMRVQLHEREAQSLKQAEELERLKVRLEELDKQKKVGGGTP